MNIFGIIVIVIFFVFGIIGYIRGFFRSAFKLVLTAFSFVLAYLLAPLLATLIIDNTNLDDIVEQKIYAQIERVVEEKAKKAVSDISNNEQIEELKENILNQDLTIDDQVKFIKDLELPNYIQDTLIENNNNAIKETLGVNNFYKYISSYIARMIINGLSFMFISLIFRIMLGILPYLLAIIERLPIVGGLNRLGGLIFGLVEGLIIVWIAFVIVALISKTDFGAILMSQIEDSQYLSVLYNKNIFLPIINMMIK